MTPPKSPRPPTSIPNRDEHVRKTPPAGVAVQIAPPTGRTRVPAPEDLSTSWPEDEHTPVGSTAIAAIDHRTKQIAEIRKEFRADITTTNDRLFVMSENMADVRVEIAGLKGAVNTLVPLLQQQLGGALQNQTVKVTAEVEVGKAQQLSEVKVTEATQLDVVEGRKWRRATIAGLVGSGGLITVLITILAGKC